MNFSLIKHYQSVKHVILLYFSKLNKTNFKPPLSEVTETSNIWHFGVALSLFLDYGAFRVPEKLSCPHQLSSEASTAVLTDPLKIGWF